MSNPITHNYLLITTLVLLMLGGCGKQTSNLTCEDFKEGKFKRLDSDGIKSYEIHRTKNQQKEVFDDGKFDLLEIQYFDNCSYLLTYLDTNEDPFEEWVNASGGILVEMIEIKSDTFYYLASIETDSMQFEQKGMLIKLE